MTLHPCQPQDEATAPRPLIGKAVLVIEDEALIAMNIESWLEDAGVANVQTVRRLSCARDALRNELAFDVVVLDLHLADGDASSLIGLLEQRAIPVIITTGDPGLLGEPPHLPHAIVLDKPFSEEEFISALLRLM